MPFLDTLAEQFNDFILIFARLSAIMAVAPLFGSRNVSIPVRAMISFVVAVIFTGLLGPLPHPPLAETSIGLMIQLAGEAAIGAAIGFAASLIFEIIVFAGYIIDYMIGFSFINLVDPQSGVSISLFSFFYNFMALILFLLVDGHHILIEIMARSYELIPVFGAQLTGASMEYLTRMTGAVFYTGFRLAAPIFIIMFMVDFLLGMLSKTVPQLQILVVGFPLKVTVGLIAVGLALKPSAMFILGLFERYRDTLLWLFKSWGSGP